MKQLIKIFFVLVMISFAGNANSQRLFFLFAHGIYSVPANNDMSNNYKFGAGGEAGVGVGMKKTFITGTIGYSSFSSKTTPIYNTKNNLTYVPIRVGLRHYVFGKLVYLKGDAGLANVKTQSGSGSSKFTSSLGAGVKFGGIELEGDYEGVKIPNTNTNGSWFGLKAGFYFGL
ncbi:MAG: hypothetical protein JWN76_2873 [Chitinophagaceae bacterium]|nr:hypothetical protein [Chitinophagaceae bacterium]